MSAEKAIREDEDIASRSEQIYSAPGRIQIADTDVGKEKALLIADLKRLISAYQSGLLQERV